MSVQIVKDVQSSGELNWPWGFPKPFPKVGSQSPEGPLQVSGVCLFLGSKFSEIEEPEKGAT